MTVSNEIIEFYKNFRPPNSLPAEIEIHNPFGDPKRKHLIEEFCQKYYNDNIPRTHLIGINPSRLAKTSTGINYTDGYALKNYCGIENDFSESRELTSRFFYMVVEKFGGAGKFYDSTLAWAMMPLSVTKESQYKNYYERDVKEHVARIVSENVAWLSALPSNGKAVVIGIGENKRHFSELEGSPFTYGETIFLPHPRWIMQYKQDQIDKYVDEYIEALS